MADRNGYIGRAPSDSSVVVARQTFSATGITTTFTFASGYTIGYLDVFFNGAKQIEGQDYDANNGSTFDVSGGGAQSGDVIEAVAYKAFNVSNVKDAPGDFTVGNNLTVVGTITGDGSALTGVAGGKFSANDTGISTTTSVGIGTTNATGAADSNNTAVLNVGVVTANFFYGNGANLTGVANTENVIGTAITMTTGNITGNLTVGGVLTYDDVTNVDSIGIITARSHVSIADSILHTGDTDTSIRFPAADTFTVETAGSERLRVTSGGLVGIGTTDPDAFNPNADDLVIFGTGHQGLTIRSGTSHDGSIMFNDTNDANQRGIIRYLHTDDSMAFHTSGGEALRITSVGEVRVGSAFSVSQAGVCTAAEFHGDGSNLTNLPAAGISTAASTVSGIVTTLQLSSAQDHKLTVSGITTITCSGGTEGESHTVRIINSGITTVGFSTFFLFPSGADPSMPTADGAISLISFTVNRVGAGGTQLLAGAALNYS